MKKLIFIIGAVVLIVGAVLWWKIGLDVEIEESDVEIGGVELFEEELDVVVPNEVPALDIDENELLKSDEPVVYEDEEGEQLKQLARVFVEAWGSQSELNDYQSLDMAVAYATELFKPDLRARQTAFRSGDGIPHIITSAQGLSIEKRGDARVTVVVSTQRIERLNDNEKKYNQKATVELVKVGEDWLVDSAQWSEGTF